MKRSLLFIFFAVSLIHTSLFAQWRQTSGPGGGNITSFASSGTDVIVATGQQVFGASGGGYGGGIYKSSNSGIGWSPVEYPTTIRDDRNVTSISISGNNIALGASRGVVFVSSNGGANWTRTLTGTTTNVTAVTTDGASFLTGTDGGGVFRLPFGTTSWTATNTGLTNRRVTSLLVSGTNVYATTAFGTGYFFKSTDGGSNWVLVPMPSSALNAFSLGLFGGKFLVGTATGVYTSTNDGGTWVGPVTGVSSTVNAFATLGTTAFAGNSAGLYSMPITGSSWTLVPSTFGVSALFVSGPNLFAGTTFRSGLGGSGVFVSSNAGSTWNERNTGLAATTVGSMLADGASIFATTAGGFSISSDMGNTWRVGSNAVTASDALSQTLAVKNGKIFGPSSNGIMTSTDGGTSWTPTSPGFTPQAFFVFGTKIFAGAFDGIRVSNDNGATWTLTSTGLPGFASVNCFGNIGAKLFVGLYASGFYVSTDSGATWAAGNTGLTSQRVRSIVTLGANVLVATDGGGVYKSTNEGGSWTATNSGLSSRNMWSLATSGSAVFVGSNDGVAVSQDGGTIWTETSPWPMITNSVVVNGTDIVIGTSSNGVWRRPLSEMITSVKSVSSVMPIDFSLEQNYPNPFNPSTNIKFQVQNSNHVSLKVFDVLGKEVATLVNEELKAGSYEATFDAVGIASGMYLYRLQAGNRLGTRKMILTR